MSSPALQDSPLARSLTPTAPTAGGAFDPSAGSAADASLLSGELMSLEGTAVQFSVLPVNLARETCSVEAESLVRRLGRHPTSDSPWLPISVLGPLLIFAHHNPKARDTWGVPDHFSIRVAVSKEQYETMRKDLVMRLSNLPLARESQLSGDAHQKPVLTPSNLDQAFRWLIAHYPYEEIERERLDREQGEALEKHPSLDIEGYNGLQPNLGVALQALSEGGSRLCFNADEVARQSTFSAGLLEKHSVFPVYRGENRVYLLSAQNNNYAFEDEWLSQGNDPLQFISVLADARLIRNAINRSGSVVSESNGIEVRESLLSHSDNENLVEIVPEDVARINPQNVNHTPEEIIHWVLYTAVNSRASDLHLEKYYNVARFRARIDGKLKTLYTASDELLPRFIALFKNYSNMSQTRQAALDARFAMSIGQRRIDVRVAAIPCRSEQQKIVMRFLDKQDGMKELSELNLSKRQSMIIRRVMSRDQGLVLVTGPTGSGKTTTLYALINSINEEHTNIHTIEDPIEYEIEGINQTQTDPTHDLTFANGLRSLLRSDPDVILIGECRDEETATAAVNSALTGHLVLTTLHANDSLRAVSRLLSMGVESHLVADSLAMTQAQRLIRRLCSYCKRPVEVPQNIQQMMHQLGVIDAPTKDPIYVATGCPECNGTGYRGRVALIEMCEINTELADLVERSAPQAELRAAALKMGFRTLYQEGLIQVLAGTTTMDEIKSVSYTAF